MKVDPAIAKLPGVFTTFDQWKTQAIIIDHKLRGKTAERRSGFRGKHHEPTARHAEPCITI
jgi:hypothetical protein